MIIEPDISVFHQTIQRELVTDLIADTTLDLIVGVPMEELGVHIYKAFSKTDDKTGPRPSKCANPEIICDPFVYGPKDGKNHPLAEEIIKKVQDASRQVFLSMGCASDTFSRWEQTARNFQNLQDCYKIGELFEKFNEVPSIVVGAGPSMEDFIKAAKTYDLTKKALIISCDAALPRLLGEGIRPHIVTRCERKFTTIFNKVRKDDTKDVFYAGYSWTPPEFFNLFDQKFMMFRDNGVNKWTGYNPGSVNGGVSSANAALELAFLFGSKTIIMTGIDLCFLDNKSHVSGTEVEFDLEKSRPKWSKVLGNNGEEVTTIPVWYRCLQEYKQAIFKHEKRKAKVFNTSLKGVKIEGTQVKSWDEVGPLLSNEANALEIIKANLKKHSKDYESNLKQKIQTSISLLKDIKHDLTKLFLFLDDAMVVGRSEEIRCINQLKSIWDTKDYFNNIDSIKKSLAELYKEPCRQIDSFKNKYFVRREYSELLLDTCQLDVFQTENRMYGLRNLVGDEYERFKAYIAVHANLFRLMDTYVDKMIELFEQGPTVRHYEPEKESIDLCY